MKNKNSLVHRYLIYSFLVSVIIAASSNSFAKEALLARPEVVSKAVPVEEIKRYQLLISENPQQLDHYNNLAVLYARKGDLKSAEKILKQGLNAKADVARLYNNLSTIYFELSREDYAAALRLDIKPGKVSLSGANVSNAEQKHTSQITKVNPVAMLGHETAAKSTTEVTDQQQITNTILGWASAWSAQEVDLYLSFYSRNFVPAASQSRANWTLARKKRLTLPRWVNVKVSELNIKPVTRQNTRVVFNQDYRSSNYSDQSKKELLLEYVDGSWLIVKENSL